MRRLTLTNSVTISFAIAAVWTVIVWGNRIALLTSDAGADDWFRIGGALAFAVALGVVAVLTKKAASPSQWATPVAWGFLTFTVAVWVPSVVRVLPGAYDIGFKVVHAVLALVSGLVALHTVRSAS